MTRPDWMRVKLPASPVYQETLKLVEGTNLHTVCQSAQCPNMGECWSRKTATVMILGNVCTRNCSFCAIASGRPTEYDLGEPARVAAAVQAMGLRYTVVTSVARDDLKDGGASVWAATIRAIRYKNPTTKIEVLIPDFRGQQAPLDIVLDAKPDILNHNIETVERLQKPIRKTANWAHTSFVLSYAKSRGFVTKSGMMLGIGEKQEEVENTLRHLRSIGVDILTLGQYLQPTPEHAPIDRWVTPAEFAEWKEFGLAIGFKVVESGPLVRSSYHADEQGSLVVEQAAKAATA